MEDIAAAAAKGDDEAQTAKEGQTNIQTSTDGLDEINAVQLGPTTGSFHGLVFQFVLIMRIR